MLGSSNTIRKKKNMIEPSDLHTYVYDNNDYKMSHE